MTKHKHSKSEITVAEGLAAAGRLVGPGFELRGDGKILIGFDGPVGSILTEALSLYEKKSQNYGEAWRSQGYMGNVARVLSKVARLKNMAWRDEALNDTDETIEDTLLDLINLVAFTIINMREGNRWGK